MTMFDPQHVAVDTEANMNYGRPLSPEGQQANIQMIADALRVAIEGERKRAIKCIEARKLALVAETGDRSYGIVRQLELVRDAIRRGSEA